MGLLANALKLVFGDKFVSLLNPLPVQPYGIVSDENSSATPLGADEKFLGTGIITLTTGIAFVSVFSDVASAVNGLNIQQSSDGINWDHDDPYTVPAGKGKNYSINPHSEFLKVDYLNGSTPQGVFRLQTIIKTNSLDSSHRVKDDIVDEDDARLVISVLKVQTNDENTYSNVYVQNPLPIDGDSVYGKDLDLSRTITTDWTGDVSNLFGNLTLGMVNILGTSPKTLTIFFQRTIITNSMGLGANTGNFSNVKITALLSGGATFVLFDGSADSTLRTSQTIQFIPLGFVGIEIEFSTTNTVTLTNVVILKSTSTVSRQQALKPDGTVTNIDATAGGNLKVSVEELESGISVNENSQLKTTSYDSQGNETSLPLTAFGDLRTAPLKPQFQGSFEYTVDNTDLNINTKINGGNVTQDSGMAIVSTSITTSSLAMLQSKRHARYKSGLGGLQRFTALFTSPIAATEQLVGLIDDKGSSVAFKNGYVIGYIGTIFGFHRFQNDTIITIEQANWDDPLDGTGVSGMTLDHTKLNVFAIQYQYLGAGAIRLFVESDTTGLFTLVHTINYANNNIEPSVHNPNFHFTLHVDNKATTSDLIIKSSSYAYFIEGETELIELHQPLNSSGIQTKLEVTTEVAIFTIRNKSIYQGKNNFIDILLKNIVASIEATSANNLGEIRLVKNATLGGTPSYNDINIANSVVEIDIAGTTVTGGIEMFPEALAGKNDKVFQNLTDYKIIIASGETITLAGLSANSATIKGAVLWKELF